ncbi:MAG TPA: hypothetical protein VF989_02985 [Polyangiaceae bacterium]
MFCFGRVATAEPSGLPPEVGYNYSEIETPRIAALAGAQRAYATSLGALFLNPANMAVARVYHVGALAQIWPEARRQSYGAAAVDSVVSSAGVAGGIGATYNIQDPDGVDRQYNDLRFALALPISDSFFAGVGGRYLWLSQDGFGPLGPSPASGGLRDERIVSGVTFDAGLTLKPGDLLAISLVGNNLNDPDNGFQPLSIAGAIGVGTRDFTVEADALADFTTWGETTSRWMLGAEVLVADHVPVRAGYRFDDGADSHALSFGLGYVETTFAAEIGLRRVVSGDEATTIVLGFSYHLEATGLTPSQTDTF